MSEQVRIDKWLWAARFFKTRSLAAEAIDRGRVKVNDERCKTSRQVHLGDLIDIDNGSAEQRRLYIEPAEALRGRPTKRDRRQLDRSK